MSDGSVTLRYVEQLVEAGLVDERRVDSLRGVMEQYATAITPDVVSLIDVDDPGDPIAKQFVPSVEELERTKAELSDPIGDVAHSPVAGVVHRYEDRVLLKVVAVCPVYCRFCFRREMVGPGKDANLSRPQLDAALDYIRAHDEIWEVILTGGDPLMLSPERVAELTCELEQIAHVKVVRWHTRMPIVSPTKISPELVEALSSEKKSICVIAHVNHGRELTDEVRSAFRRLAGGGIMLGSQSVLLAGVNDDVDTLEGLMRGLVEVGVRPYYLHHPDLAPGTGHFRISLEKGQQLVRALRDRVSGIAQPTYVLDIPGGVSKALVGQSDVREIVDTQKRKLQLRGKDGSWHDYDDSVAK